jgi:hypothetical protein
MVCLYPITLQDLRHHIFPIQLLCHMFYTTKLMNFQLHYNREPFIIIFLHAFFNITSSYLLVRTSYLRCLTYYFYTKFSALYLSWKLICTEEDWGLKHKYEEWLKFFRCQHFTIITILISFRNSAELISW